MMGFLDPMISRVMILYYNHWPRTFVTILKWFRDTIRYFPQKKWSFHSFYLNIGFLGYCEYYSKHILFYVMRRYTYNTYYSQRFVIRIYL